MKWLHNLLKGMSLTAALFVFQACYGTPAGLEYPIPDPVAEEDVVEPQDENLAGTPVEAVLPEDEAAAAEEEE